MIVSKKEKDVSVEWKENRKLKEKLGTLEKECLFQKRQEDPKFIKQESAKLVLCDIQVKPNNTSPWRSHMSPKQDLRYDKLLKLNSSIMDYDGGLIKNGQEKQLKCISVSIMKLSKEFMETEQKIKTKMKTGLSILLLKCKSSLTYLFILYYSHECLINTKLCKIG